MNRRHFILASAAAGYMGTSQAQNKPAKGQTLLVLGDSLSAEYGLRRGTGWVALLEQKLAAEKLDVRVINASVSGHTTSGGRSRLSALLAQQHPDVVVIELGGNDALRGLSLAMTEDNLTAMVRDSQKAGAKVLLLGMQLPPNYGAEFGQRFAQTFEQVARAQKAGLVPFFLKGVADGPDPTRLFQADRIHPREEAHPTLLANVWPELSKLIRNSRKS